MKITRLLGKVLAGAITASAFLMGVEPISSFAEEAYLVCICDSLCTEEAVNDKCEVCMYDLNYCEGDAVVVSEREEAVEPVEPFGPLTPEGNLTLVDDYGSIEAGGKQFITVVTKSGNYFYIIIDRDDKGNESVHFLNKVDESDLLKLMDDEEVEAYTTEKEAEVSLVTDPQPSEEKEIVIIEDEPVPGSTGNIATVPEAETETTAPNSTAMVVPVIGFVGLGVAGFILFKKKGQKKPAKKDEDLDDWDDDDEDVLSDIPVDKALADKDDASANPVDDEDTDFDFED